MSGRNQISRAENREAEDHNGSGNAGSTGNGDSTGYAGSTGNAGSAGHTLSAGHAFRLAGGIAHDLNTILTTVYGYCEMALESLDDASPAGRNVRKIIEAADRARQLTGRLLDLDRASSEEKLLVKVSDIIEDTIGFLRPTVKNNISLSLQMKSPDLTVEAIPSQLFRVFMNIVVNALHAMEEGGGRLTVTLDVASAGEGEESGGAGDAEEAGGPGQAVVGEEAGGPGQVVVAEEGPTHALIRFADTGAGIDQETATRIFEPYFTGNTDKGGTGLGLAVVKDIVTEMNGTLKVRSEKGKGTVIDLLIPAVMFGSHPGKS